ncbi:class I SAM-dependent methyltransferase [Dyella amyloliquefaciens]|uniref:class I SAM-dependent methyltransferase n=1 Tax=Dyella amyloliquefaciens TaxID=1770545 RepID=UPI00102E410E|nr:class I SAM-dependent methyltransferase [Dyella amyloliquefaciens]
MVEREEVAPWCRGDLEDVLHCPACTSSRHAKAYDGMRDHLEGVPGEWAMWRCLDCGSFYLSRRPNRLSIGKAYASYHTHGDGAASFASDNGSSLLWRWSNGYMNARYGARRVPESSLGRFLVPLLPPLRQQLDYFYRHLPGRPGRLLDVGCGNGVFLLRARDAGWQVQGLEPDPAAASAARAAGLDVVEGTLDTFQAPGSFDAVTSSHVIEHVHDPRDFVRKMFALLRVGGFAWLATPNAQGLGHQRYGRAWRGLEPPRHMTVLTPSVLRALLQEAGFSRVTAHRRGRGSRYMLQASAELSGCYGEPVRALSPLLVDVLATLHSGLAEECVISAYRANP